jgi:signal transduction histidine kinase
MLRPRPLDLPDLLAGLGKMLVRTIGETVHLTIRCAENLPPILADQVNLEQIVINLVVNARDAMPRGGPLTITAQAVVVDSTYKERQADAVIGTFVKLSVADKGMGMDEAIRR